MKKIIISLIAIILLTGCGKNSLKTITYDELKTKINNTDTFVLYVGRKNCSHCQEYKPVLEKIVSKYKLEVFYIDLEDVSLAKYNAVMDKVNGEGTPTTVFIKNGKTQTSPKIIGARDYDTIVDFFKEIGYIGE